MTAPIYFFGDARLDPRRADQGGHFLYRPNEATGWVTNAIAEEPVVPWTPRELNRLAEDPALVDRDGYTRNEDQHEGIVRVQRRNGWTAIAFWDRTGDERLNCVSVFLGPRDLSAAEVTHLAAEAFPQIWSRITGRVSLVLPAEAPRRDPGLRIEPVVPVRIATSTAAPAEPVHHVADLAAEVEEPEQGERRRLRLEL